MSNKRQGHQFTRYTKAFRKEVIENSEKIRIAGGNLKAFAESHTIPLATLYTWRHKAGLLAGKRGRPRSQNPPKAQSQNQPQEDTIVRSGSHYTTGYDYSDYFKSMSRSLRRLERYISVTAIIFVITGLLFVLGWLSLPYFIA